MRLVILESPYSGDVEENLRYARACMKDCLSRAEAPFASHLLYTQPGVYDDDIPDERSAGICAGFAWHSVADALVVYTDRGISPGMKCGIEWAQDTGLVIEFRKLGAETDGASS